MMNRVTFALALLTSVTGTLAAAGPAVSRAYAATPPQIDQATWASTKKRVQLPNGIAIAYVEAGNPHGEPLLLLHGYTDTSRAWTILVPFLSNYRLLIPDLRGHGASTTPDCCYAIADFAYDARLFLDALGVDRAAIAGHSLGSMIAQRFAAEYPDRATKVALLGSTARPALDRGHWLFTAVDAANGRMTQNPEFLAQWSPSSSPTPVDPAFLRFADAETARIAPIVWTSVVKELTEAPVARHAADVTAPVVILSAGKDIFFDSSHHQSLLDAYPGAASHIFPDLGHDFIKERPAEVGPVLARMLASAGKDAKRSAGLDEEPTVDAKRETKSSAHRGHWPKRLFHGSRR